MLRGTEPLQLRRRPQIEKEIWLRDVEVLHGGSRVPLNRRWTLNARFLPH